MPLFTEHGQENYDAPNSKRCKEKINVVQYALLKSEFRISSRSHVSVA